MNEATQHLQPDRTALLVRDYQQGIVLTEKILSRQAELIEVANLPELLS